MTGEEAARWAAWHGCPLPRTDAEAGIPDFRGTIVDRISVDALGRLSVYLYREQGRARDAGDDERAGQLGSWGDGVWNMWCDKRWNGVGRWPPRLPDPS